MNSTFKVVFNKARGALMVVNEVTSSVQAKGTKTVVATAVAAMIAGVASAATTHTTAVVIGAGQEVVVEGTTVKSATDGVKNSATTPAPVVAGDTIDDTAPLTLKGGKFVVTAKAGTDGDQTVTGITTDADGSTIAIIGFNGGTQQTSTLTVTNGVDLSTKNATLSFDHIGDGANAGLASLVAGTGKGVTLGGAKAVTTVDVTAKTSAKIAAAATKDVDVNNVVVKNAGELEFDGTNINIAKIDMTGNTGTVTFTGVSNVNGSFVNAGKTIFAGKTNVNGAAPTTGPGATPAKNGSIVTGAAVIGSTSTNLAYDTLFTDDVTLSGASTNLATFKASSLTVEANKTFTADAYGFAEVEAVTVKNGKFASKASGGTTVGTLTVDGGDIDLAGADKIGSLVVKTVGTSASVAGTTNVTGDVIVGGAAAVILNVADDFTAAGVKLEGTAAATMAVAGGNTVDLGVVTVGKNGVLTATAKNLTAKSVSIVGDTATASVTITGAAGDKYNLGDVTVGKGGSLTTTGTAGSLKMANVTLSDNGTASSTIDTTITGTLSVGTGSTYTQTSGKLTTAFSNILSKDITSNTNAVKAGLTISTTDLSLTGIDQYTVAQHTAINALTGLTSVTNLHLSGDLQGVGGKLATWTNVATVGGDVEKSKIEFTGANAAAFGTAIAPTMDYTLGSLTVTQTDKTAAVAAVTIGDGTASSPKKTVLRGDKEGNIFDLSGVKKAASFALKVQNVTLGAEATDTGAYLDTITVVDGNTLTIGAGDFTLGDIAKDGAAGTGTVSVANGAGLTVLGTLPTAAASGLQVRTIGTANGVTLGDVSYFAAGNYQAQAKAKLAEIAAGLEEGKTASVLYIGEAVKLGDVTLSTTSAATHTNYTYVDLKSVAANGYTTDHRAGIVEKTGTAGLTGLTTVILGNLNAAVVDFDDDGVTKTINLGNFFGAPAVDFGTSFYDLTAAVAGGVVTFAVDEDRLDEIADMGLNTFGQVKQSLNAVTFGQNALADKIVFGIDDWEDATKIAAAEVAIAAGLFDKGTTVDDVLTAAAAPGGYGALTLTTGTRDAVIDAVLESFFDAQLSRLVNEENTLTNMAVIGGAFSAAIDVNNEIRNAVDRRTSVANGVARNEAGITPWVDVLGTKNEGKKLFGKAGYEADISGAVLGADWVAPCGSIIGASIAVGQSDSNSVDNGTKVDNDADFVGFSVYGAHQMGNVNGKFDIGYVSVSNDLSANGAFFGSVKESLDADLFTIGLGAEYLAKAGSVNIVPHAGIRYTRLDIDDSQYGARYDAMGLFQMPVGVTFSGAFDTNGMTIVPSFDLTVVPAFGDKEAVATYFGGKTISTQVVDTNPVQATLGVAAQMDAWTFGLNYSLTAGGDKRMNNALNANVRYTF